MLTIYPKINWEDFYNSFGNTTKISVWIKDIYYPDRMRVT